MPLIDVSSSEPATTIPNRLNDGENDEQRKCRRVQFEESNNAVVHVPRNPKDTWYSDPDYRAFKKLWRFNQVQIEQSRDTGFCLELLGWDQGTMEMYQSFSREAWIRRNKLRNIVFRHQDECRSKGLYDPDGASILSKSVSEHDQHRALKSAKLNAMEAYSKEMSPQSSSPTSVSNLFFDMEENHPLECFSCAFNWQFENMENNLEIANYQHTFTGSRPAVTDSYADLSDEESMSSSSSCSDKDVL